VSVATLPERAVSAVEPPPLETLFALRPEPCAFVIFGGTGDLSRRRLMPARRPTLFIRADEVEEQWGVIDVIVASWRRDRPSFPNDAAGTWSPAAGDEFPARDGREWRSR
jgi:glucose-6-phosphate 1-dehydrogenase